MRSIGFLFTCCFVAQFVVAQQAPMPIQCAEAYFSTLSPENYDNQCIIHIEDGEVSGLDGTESTVVAATDLISITNSTISPGPNGIDLLITGERNTLELGWYAPEDTYVVPEYEKLELGVKLPEEIQLLVDQFIENGEGGLNPFNPEDINVEATFEKEVSPTEWQFMKRVYGFYYEEFEMNYNLPGYSGVDESDWDWVIQPNEHSFRVRYAPPQAGRYRCKITLEAPGETYESIQLEFDVGASDDPGYIRVAGNNKYLEYPNGELFFPVSANFNATGDFLDESLTYYPYAPNPWSSNTLAAKGFDDLHDQVTEWKDFGGDMVRTISMPWAFDIEYEELNDYSDRMTQAWELDRYLEKLESIDMKLEWNIQVHYPLEFDSPYTYCNWDWFDNYFGQACEDFAGDCNCLVPVCATDENGDVIVDENDQCIQAVDPITEAPLWEEWSMVNKGYCYHTELGLETPIEFFQDELARAAFKSKVRYLISRYGYSTSIAIIELLSEINNTGRYWDEQSQEFELPWKQDINYRIAVADWQYDMAKYIKDDLGHTEHILAPSYLTDGIKSGYNGENPDIGDYTYTGNPYLDVICESHYSARLDDHKGNANRIRRDPNITKPMIFSELGLHLKKLEYDGNLDYCWQDVGNLRNQILNPFTGIANVSNNWDDQFNEVNSNWSYIQPMKEFLWGLNLNEADWNSFGDTSDSLNLSMSYIRTGLHQDGDLRIFGVLFNHRFNEFNMPDCNEPLGWNPDETYYCGCTSLWVEANASKFYLHEVNIDNPNVDYAWIPSNSQGLTIPNMGYAPPNGKKYNMRFYDPLSGNHFFEGGHVEVFTNNVLVGENGELIDGQLNMYYPPLSNSTPFLFFELWDDDLSGPRGMISGNNLLEHLLEYEQTESRTSNFRISGFQFYPNPVLDVGNLQYKSMDEVFKTVRLFDVTGKLILEIHDSNINTPIDFTSLSNGLYTLQVSCSEQIQNFQIIKQ